MTPNIVTTPRGEAEASYGAKPTSWSFAVGFTVAAALAFAVVRPYWVPLFLGAVLAVTLEPVYLALTRFMGNRPRGAAALTALLLLLVVLTPLASLVAYGATEVNQGVAWLKESVQLDTFRELIGGRVPAPVQKLMERALGGFQVSQEDLSEYTKRGLEVAQQATPAVAGASAALFGNMLLMLLSLYFFLADGGAMVRLLMQVSPLQEKHTRELVDEFRSVASASMLGMAFTGVGQATVLVVGFAVAGLPHLFFFGVLTLISAFVPLLGTMLVWLPCAAGFAITGHGATAAGLAVYSIVATNVVDGGLKPMVLQGKMAMHGGLLFLGILGGLGLFGPAGVIAGPLCIAFFTTFLTIYRRDYLKTGVVAQAPTTGATS